MATNFALPTPPWMVNPDALSSLLDSLRQALRSSTSPAIDESIEATALPDHPQLLERLQALLRVIDNADLDNQVSAASVMTEDATQAVRLYTMLEALQPAWLRFVSDKLGPRRLKTLRELLQRAVPDLLGLLGRGNDENSHSDVLRWLLDPRDAPTIAPTALRMLSAMLTPTETWRSAIDEALETDCLSVRREYVIGAEWRDFERDRIDIVISGGTFVLAIENKVWAPEHDNQTQGYWEWLTTLAPLHAGLFLTPAGLQPRCADFIPISYLDTLGCLLEAPSVGQISAEESIVLAAYAKTLSAGVLRAELRPVISGGTV